MYIYVLVYLTKNLSTTMEKIFSSFKMLETLQSNTESLIVEARLSLVGLRVHQVGQIVILTTTFTLPSAARDRGLCLMVLGRSGFRSPCRGAAPCVAYMKLLGCGGAVFCFCSKFLLRQGVKRVTC